MAVGIIAEYNPFHNGHLYHIGEVKKKVKDEPIIIILGGNFLQRGEASTLNKWDKTLLALFYGADLVVELPFPFATQSADSFAHGAISLLKALNVDKIAFGSESDDIEMLQKLADIQLNHKEYHTLVKTLMKEGSNYPTAQSKALKKLTGTEIKLPNDILALSYLREIKKQNASITPISIKRTNDFHKLDNSSITSAESIRNLLKTNTSVSKYIPEETEKLLTQVIPKNEDYYPFLKYQIYNNWNHLEKFQTVDEGMKTRIQNAIKVSNTYDELINHIKTKRYTYNRIQRMLTHILCNFTKDEANQMKEIEYIRILGFSVLGKEYLNTIKKEVKLPMITTFSKGNSEMLNLEMRITACYSSIFTEEHQKQLIEDEYKKGPIQK